jgi:hypothetical protein
MSSFTHISSETSAFLDDAHLVVRGVRRALAEILASVAADPNQPQEISRKFGLDKTLAWKVARVVREHDPSDAVGLIPRRPSFQLLVAALQKHGATEERISALWTAFDAFEKFVQVHSDDRETLEIMVGTPRASSGAKRLEAFRKTAFQANSAIWGVRVKLQVCLHMMAPHKGSDDLMSTVTIAGFHDFKRLRPDARWSVATVSNWDVGSDSNTTRPDAIVPIDPALSELDAPLLREFCTQPLPAMRSVKLNDGRVRFELTEGPVGNTAAATVLLGWASRGVVSRYERYPGEHGEHGVFMSTPAEAIVHDLLVHKSLDFARRPTAHVFSELPGGPRYLTDGAAAGVIKCQEELVDLGSEPPDVTTPEFPRYREMTELAAESLGFDLSEFHGHRMRLAFPPIPTLAILRHALLQRPT